MEVRNQTRHEVVLQQAGHFGIELPLDCGEVDLHNFADYAGYEESGSEARLHWHESKPDQLFIRSSSGKKWTKETVREVVWVFENAKVTRKAERDPEMPLSEDQTLAEYRVLVNDASGCRVEFTFHGGVCSEVTASRQYALVS